MPSADHCSSSERCQIEAARSALRIVEVGRPCLFQPCFVACATILAAYSPALHRPSPQRRGIVFSCPQLVAFCVRVCAVCRGDAYFTVVGLKAGGHPVCAPRKHGCSPKPDLRRIAQAFCVYAHAHAHARRYRLPRAVSGFHDPGALCQSPHRGRTLEPSVLTIGNRTLEAPYSTI